MKMSLRVSFWYLLSVLCILNVNTATPLTNSTSLETPSQTNTSLSTTLETSIEDFAISPRWNGTLLPSTACFMTSIFALTDLALQHFTSTTRTNTWQTCTYPELAISVIPPPSQLHTPVCWAVWGIGSAIKTMLANNRYETASFALDYQSTPVGFINYSTPETAAAPTNKPEIEAASGPFGTTETEISIPPTPRTNSSAPITYIINDPASNTTNSSTVLQLEVSFTTVEIDPGYYFSAIVDALVALAPLPASDWVKRWSIYSPGSTDHLEIAFPAIARSGAPFLTIGYVVRALGSLPGILLQRGIWREADVDVIVDGAVVSHGTVRRRLGSGAVGSEKWGAANVTLTR